MHLQPARPETAPFETSAQQTEDDRVSLPAWIYRDAEFLAAEQDRIFRPSWQIVCHLNDIPHPGDYQTLEFLGEPLVVLRGADHVPRAFYNVCRHRASRLLDGTSGHCAGRVVCPYHAWTYGLDGQLLGMPERAAFGQMDLTRHGLAPLDLEVWHGFVFVRMQSHGTTLADPTLATPTVADMMAPIEAEIAPYQFENLMPIGRVTSRTRAVNWKNVCDNYSDALHIRVAHPGLKNLFGHGYGVQSRGWVDTMWGTLVDQPSPVRSERMYQAILPDVAHLPQTRQKLWSYHKLWPNMAFDVYPDQVDFMQSIPVGPTTTIIREIAYALPDDRREMRAARYLNWRINRRVSEEDRVLIERVQQGMGSSSYSVGPIGDGEVSLRSFARRMRALIPAARLHHPPAPGWRSR